MHFNSQELLVCTRWSTKTDTQFYCWDNLGNSAPILTILLLIIVCLCLLYSILRNIKIPHTKMSIVQSL